MQPPSAATVRAGPERSKEILTPLGIDAAEAAFTDGMAKNAAPAKKAAGRRCTMSDDHKAALAEGREQGRAVRLYLEALYDNRPKRGRTRTRETVERRLAAVESAIDEASPVDRLHLIQERLDLEAELAAMDGKGVDLDGLEDAFVDAAAAYGSRRGISYSAGVPPRCCDAPGSPGRSRESDFRGLRSKEALRRSTCRY